VSGTATYLYAITRPIPPKAVAGMRGVGGAEVRVIDHQEIACLVSTVDLSDFGEQALAAHLEDLNWLARTAREHDEVIRAAARITTTMPLRMATVCLDDAAAQARVETVAESAAAVLPELDDRDEWGVKMFAVGSSADAEQPPEEPATGTAYLLQRRRQLERRDTELETAAGAADAAFARLAEVAVASRHHRPQDQRLSGVPHPMVLNAAFLVDRDAEGTFRAVVAELAAGRPPQALVLTGPWPPYSFVPGEQP